MMIFKINFHSFVDVITNSSTELFVIDTDKSLELIKEFLQDIFDYEKCERFHLG